MFMGLDSFLLLRHTVGGCQPWSKLSAIITRNGVLFWDLRFTRNLSFFQFLFFFFCSYLSEQRWILFFVLMGSVFFERFSQTSKNFFF